MTKRTTLTFSDRDEDTLAAFADPERPERAALAQAAAEQGISLAADASEAALVRALVAVGAALMREEALERGYRQLAEIYPEVHDTDEARARRRRYADRIDRVMPG